MAGMEAAPLLKKAIRLTALDFMVHGMPFAGAGVVFLTSR